MLNALKKAALAALALVAAASAQASLIRLDAEQVLDDVTHLVWLYDWGLHGGSWQSNNAWAASLEVGGFDDWALPTIGQYQDLWADVGSSATGLSSHFANVDPYPPLSGYWSSTTVDSPAGPRAVIFLPQTGSSYDDYQFWIFSGVAVRHLPEPGMWTLLPLVIGAAVLARRRRPATGRPADRGAQRVPASEPPPSIDSEPRSQRDEASHQGGIDPDRVDAGRGGRTSGHRSLRTGADDPADRAGCSMQ